jgi:endonuclease-3
MTKKQRYDEFVAYFEKHAPQAETELIYTNGYEMIVAVILSAQCTDVRINATTPALFKAYPDVQSLAMATFDELFPYIRSISYPNNKTKYLIAMAQRVVAVYGGAIPSDTQELETLQGVGRKTANVVASVLFDQPKMAVDTHVFRVSNRLGLTTRCTTPKQSEQQLVKHLPVSVIHIAHHWLILHGRYVCTARSPKCSTCGIQHICQTFTKENKKKLE